jgi:homoserine/homoserine lactone efflux protein
MTFSIWAAFIFASVLIIAAPGPLVTLLITTSISKGKNAALCMIPGIFLGDLTAMFTSFAGVGALLLASTILFNIMKLIGAIYLIYLGMYMWSKSGNPVPEKISIKKKYPMLKAFWVTVLNPKSFLFFVAFMPQFVNKSEAFLPQLLILGATFLGIGLLNDIAYTVLANKAAQFLNNNSHKLVHRIGAINLIITGITVISLQH